MSHNNCLYLNMHDCLLMKHPRVEILSSHNVHENVIVVVTTT
jgi:hypothetical protein